MRTVFVTGPGGAGRTTVAAATALAAARAGQRALILSTDPGDTLGPLLGTPIGTDPAEVAPGLWAARTDPGAEFRTELLALQDRSAAALDLLGANRLEAEELTELPGTAELALLRTLRTLHEGTHPALAAGAAGFDLVVVDMPPTPQAIACLALPEQLRRYLRRLVPAERQAARALRPVLAQLAGVPMPAQWVYATAARWEAELAGVQAAVESPDTTVRLVLEPGPAAVDALRTARTGLALYGRAPDLVVANRLLPTGSTDPWLAGASAGQQELLKQLTDEFPAVRELAHLGQAPRSLDDLARLDVPAEAGRDGVPAAGPDSVPDSVPAAEPPRWTVEDRLAEDNVLVWHLPLPGATRDALELVRRGDELVLAVGPFRRIVPLPSALRRCTVSGAGLRDGELRVRFTPDPALWPRTR
ncbi:ArsA family ATPase [Streptomyces sp. SYSU K217416]